MSNSKTLQTDNFGIVKSNDIDALKSLLSQKSDLNVQDEKKRTPLCRLLI